MSLSRPCLKSMCRGVIRNSVLNINPHVHLFNRVNQLGLPSLLAKYLVYDMSLEEDLSLMVQTLSLEEPAELLPGGGGRRNRGRCRRSRHNQTRVKSPS